jgi:hypothetical protein
LTRNTVNKKGLLSKRTKKEVKIINYCFSIIIPHNTSKKYEKLLKYILGFKPEQP